MKGTAGVSRACARAACSSLAYREREPRDAARQPTLHEYWAGLQRPACVRKAVMPGYPIMLAVRRP